MEGLHDHQFCVGETAMSRPLKCWCGNVNLVPFSSSYQKCSVCETLISSQAGKQNSSATDPENSFYGKDYWFTHQKEELHQPDIIQRARQDIPERCIHWLRTVLKYKFPPGRVLEIGCGHGGFTYLLRQVGFEATGLEISPWVVEFAKKTFQVPMLLGPVENQRLEKHSFDAVILIDVLEHLPNPAETLGHCLTLLKPEGALILQTPCLPEDKSYQDLVSRQDLFLEMLIEKEHIFLFSQSSIRKLLHRLGTEHLEFEPAIFSHYDMFLVARRTPLAPHSHEEVEKALSASASGRMVQALFDLEFQKQQLFQKYTESEADRSERLNQINELTRLLKESEADRAARLDQINELSRLYAEQKSYLREKIRKGLFYLLKKIID